jgi:hypothetical protein
VFLACLASAADDPTSPLRIVIAMRSDFFDRVAEDRLFLDQLARGLVFLPKADRPCLREALVQPLEAVGFRFEDPTIVEEVLDSLLEAPAALPLLQFAGARLWEMRDQGRRLITRACYGAIGGVVGALAEHADRVVGGMTPQVQRATRAIFQRLVTADRTRAALQISELLSLDVDRRQVEIAIDLLVSARLLVTQCGDEGAEPTIEIVHESLIESWPMLRRWLDERHEQAAFLEHVRAAARKWESTGRPRWRLWTGDTADEARRFMRRYGGEFGRLERDYLNAVIELSTRAARLRRRFVMAAFAFLLSMIVVAGVALVRIHRAERAALEQQSHTEAEAIRARAAEREVSQQLAIVREKERARLVEERARQDAERAREMAMTAADRAQMAVAASRKKLARASDQLGIALELARKESGRATALAGAERAAREQAGRATAVAAAERAARERLRVLLDDERKRRAPAKSTPNIRDVLSEGDGRRRESATSMTVVRQWRAW